MDSVVQRGGQVNPSGQVRDANAPDLIWGAEAIGREINRSARQTFYLLEQGLIPGRKIGNQWTSTRRQLRQHVAGEAQG